MYLFFGIGLGTHFNEGRPWQHMQAEAIGIEIDFPIEFGKFAADWVCICKLNARLSDT